MFGNYIVIKQKSILGTWDLDKEKSSKKEEEKDGEMKNSTREKNSDFLFFILHFRLGEAKKINK